MSDKIKAPRSAAYPALNLEDALVKLDNLRDRIGVNGPFNRETVATGIGYASLSGASARAVAALVHYGLLTRDKEFYSISRLGHSWLFPTDDDSRDTAVGEAALNPRLFAQLYSEYQGQVLPKLLSNRLFGQYAIQQKVAPEVVEIFRSTMKFAGFLDDNDVIKSVPPPDKQRPNHEQLADDSIAEPAAHLPSDSTNPESQPEKIATVLATDQGVNHLGDGWQLTVSLKSVHRLSATARDKVRDLMKAADDLTDELEGRG